MTCHKSQCMCFSEQTDCTDPCMYLKEHVITFWVAQKLINICVTVTGKHGSNYWLSLSCNRKSKKLNLTNLFNSQH